MKRIFNIILFALFCASFAQAQGDESGWSMTESGFMSTSFAQAQGDKTFEFTYKGQTLKYEVANGNEAKVSKQQSERISGDVKIPESVTFAGKKFRVTTIGKSAFCHCKGLTSVTIPNSVTTIGMMAFGFCESLTSVTIPNSVKTIGEEAFADCGNLKSINVAKDNSHYCSENGVLFDITKKRLIQCPCGIKGNYVIPDGVTTIGKAAFEYCTGLTSVTIPNSVTTIGNVAFWGCFRLTILTIENATPPEVRGGAFEGISENITIYVPAESVEKYKAAKGWSRYADKIKAIEK